MQKNYRITSGRHDIRKSVYKEFEADDDTAALTVLEQVVKDPTQAWSDLELVRVNVVEDTTFIANDLHFRGEPQGRC